MENLEKFIEVIKDYGAAIISTISVGGVGAVAGIIAKVKKSMEATKDKMNAVLEKKDTESKAMKDQYNSLTTQISNQQKSIDQLTQEISKIHHE